MNELAFVLFASFAMVGLLTVLINPVRFVTVPVVSCAVWFAYIMPQAYGILHNPSWLPPKLFDAGFTTIMVMSALCILCAFLGWGSHRQTASETLVRTHEDINPSGILICGLILLALNFYAVYQISGQSGGLLAFYSVEGAYDLDWRGEEVLYSFIKKMSGIGATCLLAFLFFREFNPVIGILLLLSLAQPLADIFILNRRSEVIFLGLSLGAPLFFVRSWWPSRLLVLAAIGVAVFVVFTFPIIRGSFLLGAEQRQLQVEQVVDEAVASVIQGERVKEFNNSIGITGVYWLSADHSYGKHFWNGVVERTVPGGLFGETAKESLKLEVESFASAGQRIASWTPIPYMSVSAPATLFANFWFFGALIFFFVGRYFRTVFASAVAGDPLRQIQYSLMIVLLPHWVAIGFGKSVRQIVTVFLILGLVNLVGMRKRVRRRRTSVA